MSLVVIGIPLVFLVAAAGTRIVVGPGRPAALGWLLVGLTPTVWIAAFLASQVNLAIRRDPMVIGAPLRIASVWGSTILDLHARREYPRWLRGRYAILIDSGETSKGEKLLAQMDEHVRSMAELLGQPTPAEPILWVRGTLMGRTGRSLLMWAVTGPDENPAELTQLDRHEAAHSLIVALCGPDQDPPDVLVEGWAEYQSADRKEAVSNLAFLWRIGDRYTLGELVEPDWYGRDDGPVYTHGGPLVDFLIRTYGAEKFFELYRDVRRPTFLADAERILGDSWARVEECFSKWVEQELRRYDRAPFDDNVGRGGISRRVMTRVQLDDKVNPADWTTLVEGLRASRAEREALPESLSATTESTSFGGERTNQRYDVKVVCDARALWAQTYVDGAEFQTVLVDGGRSACVAAEGAGPRQTWVEGPSGAARARLAAFDLFGRSVYSLDPASYLRQLGEFQPRASATYHIERLERQETKEGPRWHVSFTQTYSSGDRTDVELEIEAAGQWRVTRAVATDEVGIRSEVQAVYQLGMRGPVPSLMQVRRTSQAGTSVTTARLRDLTEREVVRLRRDATNAVDAAVRRNEWQRQGSFPAIAMAWAIVGVLLVTATRLRK